MARDIELPNAHLFVDGPVYYNFDEYGWRGVRPRLHRDAQGQPIGEDLKKYPLDICKAEPLDECYLATDGGGAEGSPGYLALDGDDADKFYAEAAPIWWIPARMYDLRNTWCTFYLKEIAPITVAPDYEPHLFIASYLPNNRPPRVRLSAYIHHQILNVGKGEWAFNKVLLANDEDQWSNYSRGIPTPQDGGDPLDLVLHKCCFIGWRYCKGIEVGGTHASGTMGWDQLKFNLKTADLNALEDGREIPTALIFH